MSPSGSRQIRILLRNPCIKRSKGSWFVWKPCWKWKGFGSCNRLLLQKPDKDLADGSTGLLWSPKNICMYFWWNNSSLKLARISSFGNTFLSPNKKFWNASCLAYLLLKPFFQTFRGFWFGSKQSRSKIKSFQVSLKNTSRIENQDIPRSGLVGEPGRAARPVRARFAAKRSICPGNECPLFPRGIKETSLQRPPLSTNNEQAKAGNKGPFFFKASKTRRFNASWEAKTSEFPFHRQRNEIKASPVVCQRFINST